MQADLPSAVLPIAFHAPMKSPDDPVPSGDRAMARLLLAALGRAGYEPEVASGFRAFSADGAAQDTLIDAGAREAERVAEALASRPAERRPRLWFTYHNHYKAPDLLGLSVSRALGIPYAIAEASHAEKRANGAFRPFHEKATEAARAADLHLVLNRGDGEGLRRLRGDDRGLVHLPPFTRDAGTGDPAPLSKDGPLRLLAVAMMRPGVKLASYRLLAEALGLARCDWRLAIVGDGAERDAIGQAFARFGSRVRFHGLVTDPARLAALTEAADLLSWPGIGEAFGMCYLEAARHGRPALALRDGGVGEVVAADVSGLLVEPGDGSAYAAAIDRLAGDRALLARLGAGALERARGHHGFASAVRRLGEALRPLTGERAPCGS